MEQWKTLFKDVQGQIADLERAIASTDGIPIRENLLPEALHVHPVETPILNRLDVLEGSGSAVEWKEITGFSTGGSVFYAEGGTPQDTESSYTSRSAGYKLMGFTFGVTGFARAAGATFEDALATERQNAIISLKKQIENAIINADGTSNSFEGLITQITAGNSAYVESIGGNLVMDDLKTALREANDAGYQISYMLMSSVEAGTLNDLVLDAGAHSITVVRGEQGMMAGSNRVTHVIDPITGVPVEVIPHRNMSQGTLIGVPERLPAPVPGRQGQRGIWWDELLGITEVEASNSGADNIEYFLKTYATLPFPGRRGAFKLTDITAPS
jgi:hypothetical protein